MAESIDELQIEITASSDKASQSIDKLCKNLEKLKTGIASIDTSGFTNSMKTITDSLKGLSNIKISGFSSFAKNINQLGNMDNSKIVQMSTAIKEFGNSVQSLGNINVSDDVAKMSELARSISRLGTSAAGKAVTNMPQLASALNSMMAQLQKAPKVSQNLIDMTNALANFARTGSSGGRAATSLGNSVKNMSGKFSGIPATLKRFDSAISKSVGKIKSFKSSILSALGVVGGIYAAINGIKESINIASDLTEVQNVVDVTFGNFKDKIESLAAVSIPELGMSELTVKQIASRFQAMGTAMGIARGEMADMSVDLTRLAGDMSSFYNVAQEDVARSLQSVFTGETEPLRKYGLDLTQATLKEWALKNGIDADIKSMSQMEKTMLRYQYVMANTTAAQGDFIRTADTWANQVRILKEQLKQLAGVLGTAFINALKPLVSALNSALSSIISFAQTVVNALGKIFGWKIKISNSGIASDFDSAASGADDIAGSTGKAAKNVDKMKAGLRAFDELKTIDTSGNDSESGGGGGAGAAGGAGAGAGDLFQLEETESAFKSKIKDLEGLGEYIGNALKTAMGNIKWKDVYAKASGFGSGLAKFLNGLFEKDKDGNTVLGSLGETLAGALNSIVYAVFSFSEEFEWDDFGYALKNGIQKFINKSELKKAGYTVGNLVKGISTSIYTALSDKETWVNLGQKIAEGINGFLESMGEIDPKTGKNGWQITADMLNSFVDAVKTAIAEAVSGITWGDILKGAKDFLGELELDTVSVVIGAFLLKNKGTIFGLLGKALTVVKEFVANFGVTFAGITAAIGGAVLAITNFIDMFKNGFQPIKEALMVIGIAIAAVGAVILGVPAAIAAAVAAAVAGIATAVIVVKDNWEAICELFSDAGEWFNTNVVTPISGFFKGLWTSVSGFFKNLWTDITKVWTTVSTWFKDKVATPVSNVFNGACTRIGQFFQGCWLIAQAAWKIASTWFNEKVITPIKTLFNALKTKIESAFNAAKTTVVNAWKTVSSWVSTNVTDPIKAKFETVKSKITTAFNTAKTTVVNTWKGVSSWFSSTVIKPIRDAFKTACDKIGGFFTSLWSGIKKGVATAFNTVLGSIESAINGIVGGINKMLSGFNAVAKKAGEIVGKDYSGVAKLNTVSLPRIKGYEAGGFPDKYSLFMAGEHGIPEIAGTVGGKTAVAGGAEITGIKDEIRNTANEEIALLRQQNALLQAILQKDYGITTNDIGKAAQTYSREYMRRTGKPAYSI